MSIETELHRLWDESTTLKALMSADKVFSGKAPERYTPAGEKETKLELPYVVIPTITGDRTGGTTHGDHETLVVQMNFHARKYSQSRALMMGARIHLGKQVVTIDAKSSLLVRSAFAMPVQEGDVWFAFARFTLETRT